MEQTYEIIDTLITDRGMDADIARVIHELNSECYRYMGGEDWRILKGESWVPDLKGMMVWTDIQIWFPMRVMQRALYWKTAASEESDAMRRYERERNFDILMKINQKFQKASYRKALMEELKIYYVIKQ